MTVESAMDQGHSTKIPTPPSSRPSSLRKPRTRYAQLKIRNQTLHIAKQESPERNTDHENRLKRYKILPAIGSCSDLKNIISDDETFERVRGEEPKDNSIACFENKDSSKDLSDGQIAKNGKSISKISNSFDEEQLEIAIRLPDGSRRECCLSSSSTFLGLLQYLKSSWKNFEMIPRNCEIMTSDVPRQVFSDFNISLHEAKIKTRTLLYLREIDPD